MLYDGFAHGALEFGKGAALSRQLDRGDLMLAQPAEVKISR